MNVAIRGLDGYLVRMGNTFEKGGHYRCLCCSRPVVPHCGAINRWHFKHKADASCTLAEKSKQANTMSDFHKSIQWAFFELGAIIEKQFNTNIADVFFQKRVFEIQYSPISISVVHQRSENYKIHTGSYPIWILNGNTQNIENYPKYLMKICIYKRHLDLYHQRTKITIKCLPPVEKMLELCCNLNLIYDLFSEKLTGRIPYLIQLYEAKYAIKKQNGITIKWFNQEKSFENLLQADREIKENCFSVEQKQQFRIPRKKLQEALEKYIFQTVFLERSKVQKNKIEYALQFLKSFDCTLIAELKTNNRKHKGKTIQEVDCFYMQKIVGYYFSENSRFQKNKVYYRNLIYSKLNLLLKL